MRSPSTPERRASPPPTSPARAATACAPSSAAASGSTSPTRSSPGSTTPRSGPRAHPGHEARAPAHSRVPERETGPSAAIPRGARLPSLRRDPDRRRRASRRGLSASICTAISRPAISGSGSCSRTLRRLALRRHGPRQGRIRPSRSSGADDVDPSQSVLVVCPTSVIDHGARSWRATSPMRRSHSDLRPGALALRAVPRKALRPGRARRDADHQEQRHGYATRPCAGSRSASPSALTGTRSRIRTELHALLDFVVPGYLPKHVDDRSVLQRLARPFVLRRTKAGADRAAAQDRRQAFLRLTSEQRTLYRRVIEARARPCAAKLRAGEVVSYVNIFAALNYLKQICNHPRRQAGASGIRASRPENGTSFWNCWKNA